MKRILLYIALIIITTKIAGQTEKQLAVSEIRQQTVVNEPLTLQKGYFKVSSQFNYSVFSTERYNNNWEKEPVYGYLSNSFIIPFSVNYGLTNSLELNIYSNYKYGKTSSSYKSIDYTNLENSTKFEHTKVTNGLTELSLGLRYILFKNKTSTPLMGVTCYFSMPIGKTEPTSSDNGKTINEATSAGCYELGAGVLVKKVFYPFSVSGTLSYAHSFPADLKLNYDDTEKTQIKYGDWVNCNAVLNYMVSDWISIGNSLNYTYNGPQEINNIKEDYTIQYLKYSPSLTFQIKNIRLTQGVSFYLAAKNANTNPLAYITLAIKI
jgi:hypothetical protein